MCVQKITNGIPPDFYYLILLMLLVNGVIRATVDLAPTLCQA